MKTSTSTKKQVSVGEREGDEDADGGVLILGEREVDGDADGGDEGLALGGGEGAADGVCVGML